MEGFEFDLTYFFFMVVVVAFVWWWCRRERCCERRHPPSPEAVIATQRENLTIQLQQDLRELRQQLGDIHAAIHHDPATIEELAKIQSERRKEIHNQLLSREYQAVTITPPTTRAENKDKKVSLASEDEDEHDEEAAAAAAAVDSNATDAITQEGTCNICLNEFQNGDQVSDALNRKCRHVFHTECVVEWLLRNKICPMCRREFLQPDDDAGDDDDHC